MTVEETVAKCHEAYHRALTVGPERPMPAALSALKPGMLLPGGNVVMPVEPTPEMIAATLPLVSDDNSQETTRLAERALLLLETSPAPPQKHQHGLEAARALIRDYHAMLAAAGENDGPD